MEVIDHRERKGMDKNQSKGVRRNVTSEKRFIKSLSITLKHERNGESIDHSQQRKINKKVKKEVWAH